MFDKKHYLELYIPARTCFVLKEKVILPPEEPKSEPVKKTKRTYKKRTKKQEA